MPEPLPAGTGRQAVGERVARASFAVAIAVAIFKVLGLVQFQVIAGRFGDGSEADAFNLVLGILMLLFAFGEETVGPAFLPVYMAERDARGEAQSWSFASTVVNLQFLLAAAAAAALAAAPGLWIRLSTREGADADTVRLGAAFLPVVALALPVLAVTTVTFLLLNSRKRFFRAQLGDGSLRAVVVAAVVALGSARAMGIWCLPFAVLAGSLAKIATHLPGLRDAASSWRPRLDLRAPAFRGFLLLVAPLLAGSAFAKVRDYYLRYYLLSADAGNITINRYGIAISDTLNVLVPYAVSVALFPFLCEMADRSDREGMGRLLGRSTRLLLFAFVPFAAVLAVAAGPLAQLLFAMGKFSAGSAANVGLVTAICGASLPFYAVERMAMKGFFSDRRTLAPVVIGLVWSGIAIALAAFLLQGLGWREEWALVGVALATTATRAGKSVTLIAWLKRRLSLLPIQELAPFLARVLVVAAASAGAAWAAHRGALLVLPFGSAKGLALKALHAADLAAIGLAATAAFLASAQLLRVEELGLALGFLRGKLLARLGRRSAKP